MSAYKKFSFALVVGLNLYAQAAPAGVFVSLIPQPNPGPGFKAYTVQLVGTEGFNVGGVANLNVTGVHQIWQNPVAAANSPTPLFSDPAEPAFGKAEWTPFDSHLLVNPASGFNASPGFGLAETNDNSNPGALSDDFLAPGAPFNTFPGTAGVGNLSFTGAEATLAWLLPQPAQAEFLRVVVRDGSLFGLAMDVIDSKLNRISICAGRCQPLPLPLIPVHADLGSRTRSAVIEHLFTVTSSASDVVWSNLQVIGPDPGNAPTLDAEGHFNWDPTSASLGNYLFNATVTDQFGEAVGTLRVRLIAEPATILAIGPAVAGVLSLIRRRA